MNVFRRVHWNYLDLKDMWREKATDKVYTSALNGLLKRWSIEDTVRTPYSADDLRILREFIRDNDMFHDAYLMKRKGKSDMFPAERFEAQSRRYATCSELEELEKRARRENMPITYSGVQAALSYLHRDPPEDFKRWSMNPTEKSSAVLEKLEDEDR